MGGCSLHIVVLQGTIYVQSTLGSSSTGEQWNNLCMEPEWWGEWRCKEGLLMDAMGVNNAVEVDELVHVISYAKLIVSHTNSEDYKDPHGIHFYGWFWR